MGLEDAVAAGQAALAAGRWKDARAAFESALSERESAEALDGLGHAMAGLGEYGAAVKLRERAFAAFRGRGETRYPAVLAAYWLAFEYAALYGNFAAASGWLERGKRLAEAAGDCPERGWVSLACALATDDFAAKERHVESATRVAERFGDTNLEFDARAYGGVCLVERGDVLAGMRQLDEAVSAAACGEVTNVAVAGEIYCKMLLACELVFDVRRAEQWSRAVATFAAESSAVWASAICRMHYGGILAAAGRWSEADHELSTSLNLYDASYRALRAGSVARLADLRVRQGRLEEAERLLAGWESDSYAERVGARLQLARGQAQVAVTGLRRQLVQLDFGLRQAPILMLLAEAELAAHRTDEAARVAGQLAVIGSHSGVAALRAYAALANGLVCADQSDPRAVDHFEEALAGFVASGLPLEAARARLGVARTLSSSRPDVARNEAEAALSALERIGAVAEADAAAAVVRSLGGRARTGPKNVGVLSKREQEVLRLVGLGLSNPEIAARLYISRKTAAHHVSSVLAKLGLRNRAEAAAHASILDRTNEKHE